MFVFKIISRTINVVVFIQYMRLTLVSESFLLGKNDPSRPEKASNLFKISTKNLLNLLVEFAIKCSFIFLLKGVKVSS